MSENPSMRPGAIPPAGVVLAGGESRRLGRDKAALSFAGEPLVARAAAKLAALVEPVVIADRGRRYLEGFRSVTDGPGAGPLAGLLGAAATLPGRSLLALACDLPLLPAALLAALAEETAFDWVLARTGRGTEPLCALYSPAALTRLERRAAAGVYSLHDLDTERGLSVLWLGPDELARFGDPARMFLNINRREDVAALAAEDL